MKSKKIAIIGHFGGNENILDGQTIKTKILYDELLNATKWEIVKVDTYYKSKHPIRLLVQSLMVLITTKDIIVLLSGNGMRFYFPLLSFFAKIIKKRIYHDVIGGNLDSYVRKFPHFRCYLNSFKVNWVETESLKRKLIGCGINNCEIMPNFKRLNLASVSKVEKGEPFRFCIFSRVMKEKGIEDAVDAVQTINTEYGREICQLDIYGRIDDGYRNRFKELMNGVSNAVKYMGTVPYDKSVEAIKGYHALLFPTFWSGEGFPGTIVDAFSAGLPVIATDWNCNSEIVDNWVNGILYPNEKGSNLKEAIEWFICHQDQWVSMKRNCIDTAALYQPDCYIDMIINRIQSKDI